MGARVYLGADIVAVYADKTYLLERKNIEQTLSSLLHKLYKGGIREVWVTQGPGSFLNIRVGTLLLNTLQSLSSGNMIFYTIRKDELYQWLYDEGHTPCYTAMFIGQRRNARLCDHEKRTHKTVRFDILSESKDDYLVDWTADMYLERETISWIRKNEPHMTRKGQTRSLANAPRKKSLSTDAYYGMDPITH